MINIPKLHEDKVFHCTFVPCHALIPGTVPDTIIFKEEYFKSAYYNQFSAKVTLTYLVILNDEIRERNICRNGLKNVNL